MIKLVDLLKEDYGGPGKMVLPSNHKAGLQVPKGGSCCANCKWWVHKDNSEEYHCINTYYQEWAGTHYLNDEKGQPIEDPKKWCSNWFEPKTK